MIYADLNIHRRINAKGNAVTLYRSFRYKHIRTRDGACYNADLLLKKEKSGHNYDGPNDPYKYATNY